MIRGWFNQRHFDTEMAHFPFWAPQGLRDEDCFQFGPGRQRVGKFNAPGVTGVAVFDGLPEFPDLEGEPGHGLIIGVLVMNQGHGGRQPLGPAGIILVQFDLIVEIAEIVVHDLVRGLAVGIVEGMPQFVAQDPLNVRVLAMQQQLGIEQDDVVVALGRRLFPGEILDQVGGFDDLGQGQVALGLHRLLVGQKQDLGAGEVRKIFALQRLVHLVKVVRYFVVLHGVNPLSYCGRLMLNFDFGPFLLHPGPSRRVMSLAIIAVGFAPLQEGSAILLRLLD